VRPAHAAGGPVAVVLGQVTLQIGGQAQQPFRRIMQA
jgi:hypothetical protein